MAETTFQDITLVEESQSQKEVTINSAISTLDKLAGTFEVTDTSGTATLTESEAAHLLIRATGALSGNLLISLPAAFDAGWRIISNETTNAHTLTVEFDGGASPETITQGEAAIFLDGVLVQMGGGGGAADGGLLEVEITKNATEGAQPSANYATWDTRNGVWVADFDAGTDEFLDFQIQIPDTWTGGDIEVDHYFYATSATSGDVVWQGAWERGNTDIDSDSFASAISSAATTTNGTSGILTKATITFTSSQIDGTVAGEPARYRLNRDANVAGDTMAGDAELLKVVFRIPVDQ